jgi:hypothetical protein
LVDFDFRFRLIWLRAEAQAAADAAQELTVANFPRKCTGSGRVIPAGAQAVRIPCKGRKSLFGLSYLDQKAKAADTSKFTLAYNEIEEEERLNEEEREVAPGDAETYAMRTQEVEVMKADFMASHAGVLQGEFRTYRDLKSTADIRELAGFADGDGSFCTHAYVNVDDELCNGLPEVSFASNLDDYLGLVRHFFRCFEDKYYLRVYKKKASRGVKVKVTRNTAAGHHNTDGAAAVGLCGAMLPSVVRLYAAAKLTVDTADT